MVFDHVVVSVMGRLVERSLRSEFKVQSRKDISLFSAPLEPLAILVIVRTRIAFLSVEDQTAGEPRAVSALVYSVVTL